MSSPPQPMRFALAVLLLFAAAAAPGLKAQETVAFDPEKWTFFGSSVVEHLGRQSLSGSALLKDVVFTDGIIEVDVAFEGPRCFAGFLFRMQDTNDYEEIYLRPHKSGLPDAVQYTPTFKGLSGWQLYNGKGFTAASAVPHKQWISLKLEISGRQARLTLDNADKPVLTVTDLKLGSRSGAIGVKGPNNGLAYFSNFRFRETAELDFPDPPEIATPDGMITRWEISQPFKISDINRERTPRSQDMTDIHWRPVQSEASGLLDIARFTARTGSEPDCVLIRTVIPSSRAETRKLSFGYSDAVTVFCNGVPLFRGDAAFRKRDSNFSGVVGLHDAVFLPLQEGDNELLLMVTESFGGWGIICRLEPVGQPPIAAGPGMVRIWETPRAFATPESVCYDAERQILYVSNYGAKFISRVDLEGGVTDLEWITGLNAPTGLAIYRDTLYAAERKALVEIDIPQARIVKKHPAPNARFLNDVAVDAEGNVYVTDSFQNALYRFSRGEFVIWLQSDAIAQPNGIYCDGNRLLVGSSAEGKLQAVSLLDKSISTLAALGEEAIVDGIKVNAGGDILVSDWTGRLYLVPADGNLEKLLDTTEAGINCADFEYIADRKWIVIPTYSGGKLLAYRLN